jgi:hypothetical protein
MNGCSNPFRHFVRQGKTLVVFYYRKGSLRPFDPKISASNIEISSDGSIKIKDQKLQNRITEAQKLKPRVLEIEYVTI